jgi:hypothetical protein
MTADASEDNFLSRERALLGDDADQFASENDKLATVEDGDDDLLGGGFDSSANANAGGEEMSGFESSFPAIDTSNEVGNAPTSPWHSTRTKRWHVATGPVPHDFPPQNTSSSIYPV